MDPHAKGRLPHVPQHTPHPNAVVQHSRESRQSSPIYQGLSVARFQYSIVYVY